MAISCLKDGHVEDLNFFLKQTLDETASCGVSVLRIVVRPSVCFLSFDHSNNIYKILHNTYSQDFQNKNL